MSGIIYGSLISGSSFNVKRVETCVVYQILCGALKFNYLIPDPPESLISAGQV